MSYSIIAAIFYILVTLAVVSGFYLFRKSDSAIYAGTWLPVTFIALMGYQTFVSGIIYLVKIKINLISIGLFNLAAAAVLWLFIVKKKKIQKYIIRWEDIAVWVIMLAVVFVIMYKRYGLDLVPTYNSVDAAVHFGSAKAVADTGEIGGMYYAALHNGLLVKTLGAFVKTANIYKIYVFGEIMQLFLAGAMFWGVIRRFAKDNMMKLIGIAATLMYILGYPLNSMLFGFTYLGMGVTVIAYIVVVADIYIEGEIDKKLNVLLLAFGCYGIFQSYVLFMPVTFFALLVCVLVKQFRDGKLISLDTVWLGGGIFLLATVLGLWYTYGGIFGSQRTGSGSGTTVASAINVEGGIYADLFSNFIFLIPFALYGFFCLIKNKKNSFMVFLTVFDIIFVGALLYKAIRGKVSSYYYYKNYYMLWLLAWILFYIGVYYLEKNARLVAIFTMALWVFIAGLNIKNIEGRIYNNNPLLCRQFNAYNMSHIYSFNRDFMATEHYSKDKLDIYAYVINNDMVGDNSYIPVVGRVDDYYWMQDITGQNNTDFKYWDLGADFFFSSLINDDVHYIMVFKDNDFYASFYPVFDELDRLYENEIGYIAVFK